MKSLEDEEFQKDAGGLDYIDLERFRKSTFELIDLWCLTTSATDILC